jgi:hypothetical protein
MIERPRHHPLLVVMAVVLAALVVFGVALELLKGDDGSRGSITEHAGTLTWVPKGVDPEPEMGSRYWTMAYPAAYASRVSPGVGVYVREKRIGFVRASKVSDGSVWVYAWIAPEYQSIAARVTESEPIETDEGPRVQIYKYSTALPAESTPA